MAISLALTVDVEDWYHGMGLPPSDERVVTDTEWLLECFDDFGVKGTFFVLGEVAQAHPSLVRRIAQAGHEIGFHGGRHRFLRDVGRAAFERDLQYWLPRLEDLGGNSIVGFRAPFFSLNAQTAWALPLLSQNGLSYDASIYPGRNDRYGWPGAPIAPSRLRDGGLILFPVPLLHRLAPIGFSGGAYLRLLPSFVVRWGFAHKEAAGQVGMVYVHPWETGIELPRTRSKSLRAELTRRVGRNNMRARLRDVLLRQNQNMGPMKDVIASLSSIPEWQFAPTVHSEKFSQQSPRD